MWLPIICCRCATCHLSPHLVTGIIEQQSLLIRAIAAASPFQAEPESNYTQVQRIIRDTRLTLETVYYPFLMQILANLPGQDAYITLDETAHTDAFNLILVGWASDAVSLPLGFVIYPTDGTWADDARTLLQRLDQVVPSERPITLLADRIHAGDPFLNCLDELGWSYVIRLPEDTYIETERDGWQEVRHLRQRRGRLRVFRFSRWLQAKYRCWFPKLPERTRLQRLLRDHAEDVLPFLGGPSFFTVIDTYGIELIHPRREGRSKRQIGKKGKSNGRWIVGIKLAWLINDEGEVVDWSWDTANEPDNVFRPLANGHDGQTVALADLGLREKDAPLSNIKLCERGTWNERFTIETNLSWVTELFHAKKLYHRVKSHLEARLWYFAALINCLLRLTEHQRSRAEFGV